MRFRCFICKPPPHLETKTIIHCPTNPLLHCNSLLAIIFIIKIKKKIMRNSILLIVLILFFSSSGKRNFFPDEDDQGLSRLTFHGYNIATAYINDVPYINPYDRSIFGGGGNEQPVVRRIITNSNFDTLSVSWRIERNDVSDMSLSSFN